MRKHCINSIVRNFQRTVFIWDLKITFAILIFCKNFFIHMKELGKYFTEIAV